MSTPSVGTLRIVEDLSRTQRNMMRYIVQTWSGPYGGWQDRTDPVTLASARDIVRNNGSIYKEVQ